MTDKMLTFTFDAGPYLSTREAKWLTELLEVKAERDAAVAEVARLEQILELTQEDG